MKTFKNLNQLFDACDPHQVTAQEVLNGRLYLKNKGWSNVKISDELRESVISTIAESCGGRQQTKIRTYSSLRFERPQHWAIARFLLQRYDHTPEAKERGAFFSYCAGQDQVWEMRELRKHLAR
jgi:hypothetical protein